MRLSSRTRSWLTYSTAILALILGVMRYMQMDALGALVVVVAVFLIAAILELDNRGIRDSEKEDFRRRTTDELPDVLDQLISNSMCPRILYSNWLRPERFKTETLDSESYGALRKFYDSVKTRNEYFSSRHMVDPQHVQKLNRSIIDAFFEICTRVSWLRESIGSGRIDDLRSRIEHTALL